MTHLADGPGQAGNFLGLEEPFSNYKNAKVCILPVPFEASTSFGHGTAGGPAALIEASRNIEGYDVETEAEIFEIGIHTLPACIAESAKETLDCLQDKVKELLQDEKFVISLGGEHTISAAPIRATAEHFGEISVLQFDAHTDLRSAYQGNPLSHASVMARVRECPHVKNIVAVGIRAMDKSEWQNADPADIFFDHQIAENPGWIDSVLQRLSDKVYISFDIDVFDASFMPATGTPEPGGLGWFQALNMLKRVCQEREVVGFDLVELMPLKNFSAPDFIAAKLVYKFLNYRFGL